MTQSYDRYPYYEEGLEEYDFPREIRTRSIQEIIEQRQQDRGIDPDWPHVKSTVEKIANDDVINLKHKHIEEDVKDIETLKRVEELENVTLEVLQDLEAKKDILELKQIN